MPRNGSGTMSVPNSFSSGTSISSSAVNANFSDVGSEITNSLPRDGQASMTGPLKAATGAASAPSITFGTDTDSGFYRKAGDTIGISVGGVEVASIGTSGIADASAVVISGIPTGVWMGWTGSTAPAGWLRMNGRTIGNASSGATERANADTAALFTHLWTNFSDSICAVSSGRGASAAADYAANKTIALPDWRGRSPFGLDDMGSSAAGRLGSVMTSPTTNGASGGAEQITLDVTKIPAHAHVFSATTSTNGLHTHSYTGGQPGTGYQQSSGSPYLADTSQNTSAEGSHAHTVTGTTDNTGSGGAHSNMPPAILTTFIIKI